MKIQLSGTRRVFVPSLIGLTLLGASLAASSQQPGQQQPQSQRQGDVQVAVAPGEAQQPQQPSLAEVRVVHVKGESLDQFEGLLKELGAALAEQGAPGFEVWQVAFGDQNTFHIVAQLESFASIADMEQNPPMQPQQWADWVGRMESTMSSHELAIGVMRPDLSIIPQEQAGAELPNLLILVTQTLLPGKRQEYQAWLGDELIPALREAGMSVLSYEMAFGSEDRTMAFAVPVASWSELDEPMPLFSSMGQQAAEQLLNRGDSMIDSSETIVLRSRPDLSFAGGQPGQQAGQQSGQQAGQQPGQPAGQPQPE